ncbi:hypothetical protein PALI_a1969 [Pseudoalteromonas aliena SW19]|uniref:Uncharacterized protein n=1 Tax=Pseudoalteromonas aliena SW19 TaxID=1314866 RepID=A0ABR9E103_9GAMM|nr:hypothetical protein [Pseudoalteromonas aliena SW19]
MFLIWYKARRLFTNKFLNDFLYLRQTQFDFNTHTYRHIHLGAFEV